MPLGGGVNELTQTKLLAWGWQISQHQRISDHKPRPLPPLSPAPPRATHLAGERKATEVFLCL